MVGRRHVRGLCRGEDGRALLELLLALNIILVAVFGFIEFSVAVNQWNLAAKAVQVGARLAAMSDPVDSSLTGWTGLTGSNNPGDPISSANGYDRTCTSTNASGSAGSCMGGGTYSPSAMQRLIWGSDGQHRCAAAGTVLGMCDILPRINPTNVSVEYKFTGLGYVGRPGGPVPTIIVKLTGLTFNFGGLAATLGLNSIGIPAFATTIVGEDLSTAAP